MKKEILFGAIALLISAGVMAQTAEPVQTQSKSKKQQRIEARQQAQAQEQEQVRSGDPIMTQTQTRTKGQKKEQAQEQVRSGDPIMTQTQTRTQNHGTAVSETAKEIPGGEGKGQIVSEQARMKGDAQKSMKQAKKASKNNVKAKRVRTNRPATVQGGGHR